MSAHPGAPAAVRAWALHHPSLLDTVLFLLYLVYRATVQPGNKVPGWPGGYWETTRSTTMVLVIVWGMYWVLPDSQHYRATLM